jgi:hypothetical protein
MSVNSTTKGCPNKKIKMFLLEDFFHLPLVSITPVVHLELRILLRISPRIFEKIRIGPKGILRCLGDWGKLIPEKSQKLKTRGTVPLKIGRGHSVMAINSKRSSKNDRC